MAINSNSGTLAAVADNVAVGLSGDTAAAVNITGTYTGLSVILEGTMDGKNWFGVVANHSDTGTVDKGTIVLSAANRALVVLTGPLGQVRVRCTAISTGTANVVWNTGAGTNYPILPAGTTQYDTYNTGNTTGAVAAGTTGANTVVVAGTGVIYSVNVTTAGTATLILYDNATTNSGTQLYASSATYALNTQTNLNLPFTNGIVARKANGSAAVTIAYALN